MMQTIPRNQQRHSSPLNCPFLQELVGQIRAQDAEQHYSTWSDESLLRSLIAPTRSPNKEAQKPGAPLIQLQIAGFYQTVAARIEAEIGKPTQLYLNVSQQGMSSALIFCGCLMVMCEWLWELHHFGFESLETLVTKGEQLIEMATQKARCYL